MEEKNNLAGKVIFYVGYIVLLPIVSAVGGHFLFIGLPQVQKGIYFFINLFIKSEHILDHVEGITGPALYCAFIASLLGCIIRLIQKKLDKCEKCEMES